MENHHFFTGKSTISMVIFNSYVTNYQRVTIDIYRHLSSPCHRFIQAPPPFPAPAAPAAGNFGRRRSRRDRCLDRGDEVWRDCRSHGWEMRKSGFMCRDCVDKKNDWLVVTGTMEPWNFEWVSISYMGYSWLILFKIVKPTNQTLTVYHYIYVYNVIH